MKISERGTIGTIVYHGLILALLLFAGLTYPDPPPEEAGILVNFGTDMTGMGKEEPRADEEQAGNPEEPVEQYVPPVKESQPVVKQEKIKTSEPDLTQDVEKTVVTEQKKPSAEELERQRQAEIERKAKEEADRIKREEELRKQQEAERISNMGKNAFGNKGTGTGESSSQGISGGTGNQGSINGSNNSDNYGTGGGLGNGISYGLGGRGVSGNVPVPNVKSCEVTQRIEVKVEIQVDQQGNVVSASVLNATYADNCIWNAVIEVAKKTKFTTDPNAAFRQTGWIKYIIEP